MLFYSNKKKTSKNNMKNLIIIFTITVLCVVLSESSKCSPKSWEVVQNFEGDRLLGRWFNIYRYQNDAGDSSVCLWHDLTATPNAPSVITEVRNRLCLRDDKYTKIVETSLASPNDPFLKVPEGLLSVQYNTGVHVVKYFTTVKYDEYAIVRACYEGEEQFWAYARNQYPCKSTLEKIERAMKEQGIDKSKLLDA